MISKFKNRSLEERINEANYMMKKHRNSICCIIEKSETCKNLSELKRKKYIIPNDLLVSQLIYIIRRRCNLDPKMAIFIYINNIIPNSNAKLQDLYNNNKDEDGFLYIKYSGENTFG